MILGLFKQKHPDVTSVMYMGDSASLIQSIEEQFFDMAILSEPVMLKQFVIAPYFTDELIIIVNSDHPWTRKECLDIEDVLREPCILREKGSGTREVFKRFLRSMDISIHNINKNSIKIITIINLNFKVSYFL